MASGTIKGSFSGTATSNVYPEIRWRSTSNTANNNSSVTAELWFVKVNSYWYPYNLAGYTCGISINGNNASALRTIDMRSTWSQKIWERTVTVGHNADGAKSITISTSGNTGLNLGTVRVSGTAKLDSIPRASSISSITGNQLGGNITVNISRASASFTHRVGYYDTDGQRRNAIQDAATSTVFSVPLDRCSLLPNSTSGTAKIVVDTYSGGTRIGSTSKNHTVYVPASVVPTTPSLTVVENIAAVKNLNLGATTFVQNKSQIGMTSSASGSHGSTIRDYTFSYNGASQGGTVGRSFNIGNVSGTREVKVVVTDSRGRKAERKFNITILAYSPPRINGFSVWRENNGTVVKANINYTVSNIGGKGGIWYVDYQEGSNWPLKNTGTFTTTHSQNITVSGSYDTTRSHTFRTNLHDAFGSGATATSTVSTSKVLMDLNKDVGIGIGKMHERGVMDVGGDVYLGRGNRILNGGGFYNGVLPSGNLSTSAYWHNPLFPQGMSLWSSIPSNGETGKPIGLDGYGLVQVFKSGAHASEVTVEYFTQPNGRIWRTGANHQVANISWTEVITNNTAIESGVLSYPDGFNSYSGDNFLRKVNGVVTIGARIRNYNQIPAGDAEITIAQLPAGYRPFHTMVSIAQGSATAVFALTIQGDGRVQLARYRQSNSSSYIPVPAGSWLNVSVSFITG